MWGQEPFIPNSLEAADLDKYGNIFASGKVAMMENPSWYLCCLGDLAKAGGEFDFASMPVGLDGMVAGRIDMDAFRIWKGTRHPAEAFTALTYLVDTGVLKLLVGSPDQEPAYGGLPAQIELRGHWLDSQKALYPFVRNWDTLLAGMDFADLPSAELYMPNFNESWIRIQTFGDLLTKTQGLDISREEAILATDLTVIFNK